MRATNSASIIESAITNALIFILKLCYSLGIPATFSFAIVNGKPPLIIKVMLTVMVQGAIEYMCF